MRWSISRPMLLLALSVTGGSLSGAFWQPDIPHISAAVFVCLFLSLIASLLFHRYQKIIVASSICVAFACGFFLSSHEVEKHLSISLPLDSKPSSECLASVKDEPRTKDWGTSVDVELHACKSRWKKNFGPAFGGIRLSTRQRNLDVRPGDRVRFKARFSKPREFRNPGAFAYGQYLTVHGMAGTGWVLGKIKYEGENDAGFLTRIFGGARERIARSMRGIMEPDEAAIVEALALGKKDHITTEMRETFSYVGVSHLLAISGLHVGLVAMMLYFLSRMIFGYFPWLLVRIPLQRLAAAITIPAMWCYVLLTGSPVSAVRAGIMLTVFLGGVLLGRRQDLLTTLAIAVIIILLLMPLSVLDVSFQLSVLSVLGIIVIAPKIANLFGAAGSSSRLGKLKGWFLAMIAVTITATAAALPMVAYHFKIVTVLGILTNIIAVPVAAFVLVPSISLASVAALISPAAAWPFWKLAGTVSGFLLQSFEFVAREGRALVFHFAPTPVEVVLMYTVLLILALWRSLPYKKVLILIVGAALLADAGYWRVFPMLNEKMEISILDVGQGDSILVRFPNGKTMLVDGGGIKNSSFDIGRNVVAPVLWRLGVHRLDWILLTHPHHDHYRGLGFISGEFKPELIWTNGLTAPEDEIDNWKMFLDQVDESGVPLVTVDEGILTKDVGGVDLRILKLPWTDGDDLNDSSLVFDLKYGDTRLLSMGDLAGAGEGRLLAREGDLSADVLKVGHHGSGDATTGGLLDVVRPETAIISVGAKNKYTFPHEETLEMLEKTGARILRTDHDGMISIVSDGENLNIDTFVK